MLQRVLGSMIFKGVGRRALPLQRTAIAVSGQALLLHTEQHGGEEGVNEDRLEDTFDEMEKIQMQQQQQQVEKSDFKVAEDVPPVSFTPVTYAEPVDYLLGLRALRAFALHNETLRASFKVSMKDKTKKRGRPRDPVRGMVVLPHVFKEPRRVVVFCQGDDVEKALNAGAAAAGLFELLEKVTEEEIEFDVAVATEEVMRHVKPAARILRKKTPTQKNGTIVDDVEEGVARFSRGQLYRSDKFGNICIPFGKSSQDMKIIEENFLKLVENVAANNLSSRDSFIEKLTVSSDRSLGGSFPITPRPTLREIDERNRSITEAMDE
eukprot:m.240117 g.240117  ORF g.240117 m.240117 type:complete len:322 (+) comp14539_c0_seq1:58-1023(+)